MRTALLCLGLVVIGCSSNGEPIEEADDVAAELAQQPQPKPQPQPPAASTSTASAAQTVRPPAAPPEPDPPDSKRFEATVHVAKVEGATRKAFAGVSLDRDEGPDVIASYSAGPVWKQLDGRRVEVVAVPYQPTGRAIMGEHMRVHRLALVKPTFNDPIESFGPEKELAGHFARVPGEPGTKAADSSPLHFVVAGDQSYQVAFGSPSEEQQKQLKSVRARVVVLSRYSAHSDGPFVWITSTAPAASDER